MYNSIQIFSRPKKNFKTLEISKPDLNILSLPFFGIFFPPQKKLKSVVHPPKKKSVSNHDFGDAIYDQVLAAQSQCGTFAFGENYHMKVLKVDGISDLVDYFALDQAQRDDYDELARQLVCARLIVNNSLSSKTRTFLKEQFVVNQSNYPDTVVDAVAMITLFGNGNDKGGGGGNNNNVNKTPESIVSIHLADDGNDCSNNDDGSVESFESIADERRTADGGCFSTRRNITVISSFCAIALSKFFLLKISIFCQCYKCG